jgi:hypothetical protein
LEKIGKLAELIVRQVANACIEENNGGNGFAKKAPGRFFIQPHAVEPLAPSQHLPGGQDAATTFQTSLRKSLGCKHVETLFKPV